MPIASIKTAGAYLIQADHLNTPRAILGASNALVWKWDSDAFGSTAANENPSALGILNYNPRFPGQYYDKESALHYNYFRDSYNPKIGRYMQSDPIGLYGGSFSTYAYVGSNPVGYRDPLGLNPFAGAIGGAQVGTAILPGIGTVVGGVIGAGAGAWIGWNVLGPMLNESAEPKPDREQKPEGCPTGTKPVDKDKRLDREKIHRIKGPGGIQAGAKDWVGISPDGRIGTNEGGQAADNGHYTDYLP